MKQTVGHFLCRRLKEAGCGHIFGVPGDFVLGLMNTVLKSEVKLVTTCNELNAAYAADAYARLNGIGSLMTTYAVGELSAINGVAGAFAESVPVVQITGAPAKKDFATETLLHHTLGDYYIPKKMYSLVTGIDVHLDKLESVVELVDKALRVCLMDSTPVYISVCTDLIEEIIDTPEAAFAIPTRPSSHKEALEEAVRETLTLLSKSKTPIFIPGVEIGRMGLQDRLEQLLDKSAIPFAVMMLGKTLIDEEHPQFIGLYIGARSRKVVHERVDSSDCVITIGAKMTDFNTGGFSTGFDLRRTVRVGRHSVSIGYHVYNEVQMEDFMVELTKRIPKFDKATLNYTPATEGCTHRRTLEYVAIKENKMTMKRLFDRVSHYLPEKSIVIAETGTSLFYAAEMMMPKGATFMGQTFYGSIGYSVGATLGACIACPDRRVVLFVGDGSFQVTAQDLSSIVRFGCTPLIFLVNNDGYLIERTIVDRSYNDIQMWKYSDLPRVFGGVDLASIKAESEGDLENALEMALKEKFTFVEVVVDKWDCNESMTAAGRTMALNNRLLDEEEQTIARLASK